MCEAEGSRFLRNVGIPSRKSAVRTCNPHHLFAVQQMFCARRPSASKQTAINHKLGGQSLPNPGHLRLRQCHRQCFDIPASPGPIDSQLYTGSSHGAGCNNALCVYINESASGTRWLQECKHSVGGQGGSWNAGF
jgi:hypothetical protein